MRHRDRVTLIALNAARHFLREHAHLLLRVIESGALTRLDDLIDTLNQHSTSQVVHGMRFSSLTRTQQSLQADLRRNFMTPIARIARADLPPTPDFQVLRMPSGRVTSDQLARAAVAMARVAEQHADTFVAVGMQPGFIDRMLAMVESLQTLRSEALLERGKRHAATMGLDTETLDARRTLRALDSLIAVELRKNPSLFAKWTAMIAQPRLGRPRSKIRRPSRANRYVASSSD